MQPNIANIDKLESSPIITKRKSFKKSNIHPADVLNLQEKLFEKERTSDQEILIILYKFNSIMFSIAN